MAVTISNVRFEPVRFSLSRRLFTYGATPMADQSFTEILLSDVGIAMRRLEASGSQSDLRDLVRTAFAAIEGTAWMFREHVVDAANSSYGLEPDEENALSETAFGVSKDGQINSQARFIPLVNSIRLIAQIGERIAPRKTINFSAAGWHKLQSAVAIRNRITHPKSASDLVLTKTDAAVCTDALFWFLAETTDVWEATNLAISDYLGEFKFVLEKLKTGDAEMVALYQSVSKSIDD